MVNETSVGLEVKLCKVEVEYKGQSWNCTILHVQTQYCCNNKPFLSKSSLCIWENWTNQKPRQADNIRKYKIKQIPKMDILHSRYSRKNKKTTESVIFRLYGQRHCQTNRLYYKQAVLYITTKFNLGRCS